MNTSRSPVYYRAKGVSPKKSPTTESVQKRRRDIKKSERAAYWALFNSSFAVLLYYDLNWLRLLSSYIILIYLEWLACAVFTMSAIYDFAVHFWPHTFMKPIVINSLETKLLGIQEDEFGFKIEDSQPPKIEPPYDNMPPFEISYSFEEDDRAMKSTDNLETMLSRTSITHNRSNQTLHLTNIPYTFGHSFCRDTCEHK